MPWGGEEHRRGVHPGGIEGEGIVDEVVNLAKLFDACCCHLIAEPFICHVACHLECVLQMEACGLKLGDGLACIGWQACITNFCTLA